MSATPILSRDEARAFLTKADLEKLEGLITQTRLQAIIDEGRSPYITVRGKYVRLFDALELMGTL
jgi:hypothetical protein